VLALGVPPEVVRPANIVASEAVAKRTGYRTKVSEYEVGESRNGDEMNNEMQMELLK